MRCLCPPVRDNLGIIILLKIIFGGVAGSTQDGGPHKVRMAMRGEKWTCEVKMSTQGENGHMR